MSLPTPPSTSHRSEKKQNRSIHWPEDAHIGRIHFFPSETTTTTTQSTPSADRQVPRKSILKKKAFLPFECLDNKARETTPEPQDVLGDKHYLDFPVSRILDMELSLRDLTEAYSILAARLRAAMLSLDADSGASWPLFQPIRKHKDALAAYFVRDLERVFVDPCPPEDKCKFPLTPRKSPSKVGTKKTGMSAEQAKYGRDLCITTHSVLKLLSLVFTHECLYSLFTDRQLNDIFSAVLAIPSCRELPTPHARKTWALTIWVIQYQRLPEKIVVSCKDRVAYVIARGIDGELGKDGKKGSRADGLRAIHDLSIHLPSVYVPAFSQILTSVIANLTTFSSPTRLLASQALGGFAQGLAALGRDPETRWCVARSLQAIFLESPPSTPTKSPSRSIPHVHELIRILRNTLNTCVDTAPIHAGNGPVWAVSVISSLIVLLAPILRRNSMYGHRQIPIPPEDMSIYQTIQTLMVLATKAKSLALKEFASCMWRVVAWVYTDPNIGGDDEPLEDGEEELVEDETLEGDDCLFRLLRSSTDHGAGVSTMNALLACENNEESFTPSAMSNLYRAHLMFFTIASREVRNGNSVVISPAIFRRLLGFAPLRRNGQEVQQGNLLPYSLFCLEQGLLTTDYATKDFADTVRAVLAQFPGIAQLPTLKRTAWMATPQGGICSDWTNLWMLCMSGAKEKHVDILIQAWRTMLQINVECLQENDDGDGLFTLAQDAFKCILALALDSDYDPPVNVATVLSSKFTPELPPSLRSLDSAPPTPGLRKYATLRPLLLAMRVIPLTHIQRSAFLYCQNFIEAESQAADSNASRKLWALFCAEVLVYAEPIYTEVFWGLAEAADVNFDNGKIEWKWSEEARSTVWRVMCEKVLEADATWEIGAILLTVPFSKESNRWEMTSEDFNLFEALLTRTKEQAVESFGLDSLSVLSHICSMLLDQSSASVVGSPNLADSILSHVDSVDVSLFELPSKIIEFVNLMMVTSYPPASATVRTQSMWLLRTIGKLVEDLPTESICALLHGLGEGLSTWMVDSEQALEDSVYGFDVVTLYENILLRVRELPQTIETIQSLAELLAAPFSVKAHTESCEHLKGVFLDMWQSSYTDLEDAELPEKIQMCLGVAASVETSATVSSENADGADTLAIVPSENIHIPIDPCLIESQKQPELVGLVNEPPSEPTFAHVSPRPCTPPPKAVQFASPMLIFPSSPSCVPITPPTIRFSGMHPSTPCIIKRSSSSMNKENESPLWELRSRSISKRKLDNHSDDEEPSQQSTPQTTTRIAKRSRTHSFSSITPFLVANMDKFEAEAIASGSVNRQLSELKPVSKKRKRVLMECVEIRTPPRRLNDKVGPPRGTLRRVVSAPFTRRTNTDSSMDQQSTGGVVSSMRKRRRVDSVLSTPTHSEPSSDDNPHIGRVTPHHLISPPLVCRRMNGDTDVDEYLGDDEAPDSSPLRRVAQRKMRRTKSMPVICLT